MDRIWASTDGINDLPRRTSAEDFALPSRGAAIGTLRGALESLSLSQSQAGPLLLTGEAGVGKTWLCRRLQAEMPPPWRWVLVDVPPETDPAALYQRIGHALGLPAIAGANAARLALADFLREAAVEGVRWVLVLDEAQNASAVVLEEVRVLTNRLGRNDGFAALILAGQTALACRLAIRPLRALAARLVGHVHLRCLDVDEARTLLNCLAPSLDWNDRTLERHHRDACGNPRRMLRAALSAAGSATPTPTPAPRRRLARQAGTVSESPLPRELELERAEAPDVPMAPATSRVPFTDAPVPAATPYRPPLLVGDGMVEVGWEGGPEPEPEPESETEPEAESGREAGPEPERAPGSGPSRVDAAARSEAPPTSLMEDTPEPEVDPGRNVEAIETVDDHYTALQAWNEWTGNRSRTPAASPAETGIDTREAASTVPERPGQPSVRIEGEQGFAPYGQLFSRLRQNRDANETS